MNELLEITDLCPEVLQEGFSAYRTDLTTSESAQLTGWTVTAPFFNNTNFNATNGVYTIPVTGVYSVKATINYTTASAISIALDSSINPFFVVKRTFPTETVLVSALLPMINLNLGLTVRGVLGGGAVTLSGIVQLSDEDRIGLFYDADGMTVSLTLENVVWSLYRIS